MNQIDLYAQAVAWSAGDNVYVGACPAFFGPEGVCHGDDPVEVLRELRGLVAEEGLKLPPATKDAVRVRVVETLAVAH